MYSKCETEIISISTNFSFFSYDKDGCIFNISLLILAFCLELLAVLRVISKPLCLVAMNIAVVINS